MSVTLKSCENLDKKNKQTVIPIVSLAALSQTGPHIEV